MALDREYSTSKLGPCSLVAYTAVAVRIKLVDVSGTLPSRRSFQIRVTTNARVLQGNSSVTATVPVAGTPGAPWVPANMLRRIDVEGRLDNYISVIQDTAAGNIEISVINDVTVAAADMPAAV